MTTPAQRAGFKVGDKALVITDQWNNAEGFKNGDIVVFTDDDGSSCPRFDNLQGTDYFYMSVERGMHVRRLGSGTAEPTAKFPIGSRVVVISSGWGLGPEHIGKTYKVKSFILRTHDHTIYKVENSEGIVLPGEIWEPSFELAAPETDIPEGLTTLQTAALKTFQSMYNAAVEYRAGRSTTLNTGYGICDNIERYANAAETTTRAMSEVKENLIRNTPSYSGEYNYPVKCPTGGEAHAAFNRNSDKWSGDYGLNRLTQLGEMIELIKTQWNDNLVHRQTPAVRNGLSVGDLVIWKRDNSVWVFQYDDESMSPRFHRLGDTDARRDIEVSEVKKLDKDSVEKRSVAKFLKAMKATAKKKSALESKMEALKKQLEAATLELAMLDYGLADQHGLKKV